MAEISLEVSPQELRSRQAKGESIILIDVREKLEHQICRIDGAPLIPMGDIPKSLAFLEQKADQGTLVFYCHHGMRSLQVAAWLRSQGIEGCQSLAGGIERWSIEVDPGVPRY